MTTYDAVASAVALMQAWVDGGPEAADKRVCAAARDPEEMKQLVAGLSNLSACLLLMRERETGVNCATTLDEIQAQPWFNGAAEPERVGTRP